MTEHPDVLIIGGGVIGLTTAYHLAHRGARVALVDRADFGQQASWAGAGILPPGNPARAPTPLEALRAQSVAMFPDLSRRLQEETGIDNGHRVCGGLELLEREGDVSSDEWRSEGTAYQELDRPGLLAHEPGLAAGLEHGYYLPDMAQVRNPRHLKALTLACEARGVRMRPACPVRRLLLGGSRVEGVETDQGTLLAGRYLVAAGSWSDDLLEQVGWRPGIRPIRGQIALLNTGAPGPRPLLLMGKRYIVPRGDGKVLVGSTEEDAGFAPQPTAAAIAGLLEFAASLLPALGGAVLERCWAGLRPGSPDGLPFLGAVPGWANLFVAAGHFRSGIQLSPATGVVMAELLQGRAPSISLEAFRLDRPSTAGNQSAFRA
jgi:glycine oxidase